MLTQGAIARLGGLIGCKKSHPHTGFLQDLCNLIGHTHVTGVECEVKPLGALSGRRGNGLHRGCRHSRAPHNTRHACQ